MTEAVTTDVSTDTGNISNEQVEKFFQSGGEVDVTPEKPSETVKSAEPAASQEQTDQRDRFVPHGALHEERERRKELQRQLQETQQRTQQMEERFKQVMERLSTPVKPEPTFEEDPLEALRTNQIKIAESIEEQKRIEKMRQEYAQREHIERQFHQRYQDSAMKFLKDNPDFKDAYEYLNNSRYEEFVDAGYSSEEAKQLLIEDEKAIVAKAFKDEINPAERLYKLAKRRGYQLPEKKTDSAEKITTIEKGMQTAGKSLSNASGKSEGRLTLEALAQMSPEEIDANWEKVIGQFR